MKVLISTNELDSLIYNEKLLIILIGSDSCMPCKAIGNKIDDFTKEYNDIKAIYVPIECFKEYVANLGILSVPTVLVFAEGKLQIKESGYFSLDKILNSIIRIKSFLD